MRLSLLTLLFSALFCSLNSVNAQSGSFGGPIVPYQPNESPIFGKDIVIHDQPNHNQINSSICSAYNGWLYAAFSYDSSSYDYFEIDRSIDNGLNWVKICDGTLGLPYLKVTDLDLVATGDDSLNLKIIVGGTWLDSIQNISQAYVFRFNGVTGDFEGELLQENQIIHDIAISTDYPNPPDNSSANSLAVIFSDSGYGLDSIIVCTSSNGGLTLDNRKVIATTHKHFAKVAISYGYCPSWPSGRYYAAWEEKENVNSNLGHIYTAHSSPNFNSSFTIPIKLDSIDISLLNCCKNPKIATQNSNYDNDNSNLSEIVLFEKNNSVTQHYDITGFYNKQSTTTTQFLKLDVASTTHYEIQPDINFNPYDSTFIVTYYDSTNQKLPLITQNLNLTNPNAWTTLSSGYNDSPMLSSPKPKVIVDYNQQKGAITWSKGLTNENCIAMFDAPYSTFTGINENMFFEDNEQPQVYPNPTTGRLTVEFNLKKDERVSMSFYTIYGQHVSTVEPKLYLKGSYKFHQDLTNFSAGLYFLRITFNDHNYVKKITKVDD